MVYSVASGIPRGMGVSGYVVAKGLRYGVVKFNFKSMLQIPSKNRVTFQGALKPQET
jgi:hypothetical protein